MEAVSYSLPALRKRVGAGTMMVSRLQCCRVDRVEDAEEMAVGAARPRENDRSDVEDGVGRRLAAGHTAVDGDVGRNGCR